MVRCRSHSAGPASNFIAEQGNMGSSVCGGTSSTRCTITRICKYITWQTLMYLIFLANTFTIPQLCVDVLNLPYPQCISDNIQQLTREKQAQNFLQMLNCIYEKPTKLLLHFFSLTSQ